MVLRMPSRLPKVVCPYCLKKLTPKDVKMVCNLCGNEIKETKTETFFKIVPNCNQPGCNGEALNMQCRHCDALLPSDILSYSKNMRFSILGVPDSGKTNFLTTMIHEIKNSETPWVLSYIDDQTRSSYEEKVKLIYEMHKPAPSTPPGVIPVPQLWRVKDKLKRMGNNIPSYSLTIFDGAGEDSLHATDSASIYIKDSKSLVILIDPLSLPHIASSVNEDVLSWSVKNAHAEGESAAMMDGLANYIKRSCKIPQSRAINRDVAVVFTKIDAVKKDFTSATVMQPSPHLKKKGFVKADADAVDAEIRDWLTRNNEIAFLDSIETNFNIRRVRFFGISSFGEPPMGDEQLGEICPHRVLDPLIWMFANEGIAKIL